MSPLTRIFFSKNDISICSPRLRLEAGLLFMNGLHGFYFFTKEKPLITRSTRVQTRTGGPKLPSDNMVPCENWIQT